MTVADPGTSPACPKCGAPLHHRQPDPDYYPGETFSFFCGAPRKDGDECHQKITMDVKR